jgi:hypothetical protein
MDIVIRKKQKMRRYVRTDICLNERYIYPLICNTKVYKTYRPTIFLAKMCNSYSKCLSLCEYLTQQTKYQAGINSLF